MMRASPLKVLPTPIPAWAAVPRDLDDDDIGGSCAAVVTVVIAEIAGDTFGDDDEEGEEEEEAADDENGLAVIVDEAPAGPDDTAALETETPPSKLRADRPHVCGATASFDVILKAPFGVLAKSSPERLSSCM